MQVDKTIQQRVDLCIQMMAWIERTEAISQKDITILTNGYIKILLPPWIQTIV